MAFSHSTMYGAIAASEASSEWMPRRRFSGLCVFGSIRIPFGPILYPAAVSTWLALAGS